VPPQPDWTPGPAKWLAVLMLGGATVAGLSYSIIRGSMPWRMDRVPHRPSRDFLPEPDAPAIHPLKASVAAQIAIRININTASKPELELLPGVGPALADRILAERARAPFARVEDLGRVRGIGAKTIEKLRPHVVVE